CTRVRWCRRDCHFPFRPVGPKGDTSRYWRTASSCPGVAWCASRASSDDLASISQSPYDPLVTPCRVDPSSRLSSARSVGNRPSATHVEAGSMVPRRLLSLGGALWIVTALVPLLFAPVASARDAYVH